MSSGLLTPDPRLREFSDLGLVLPGAKLFTYVAGTPATPLATYSDVGLTTPNANPIIASSGGLFGPIFLTPGVAYKFLLTDTLGVTVPGWPQDNISVPAGAGAVIPVTQGGTGLSAGTSGGVLYFSAGTTLASSAALTAHGVVIGGGAGVSPATTSAGTTGQVLTSNGAAADPTFQALPAPFVLLKANSGTDTTAAATNVDTIAITGLTAKDLLLIKVVAISVTQATANIGLYNATDGIVLNTVIGTLAAGATGVINFDASQSQASTTSIITYAKGKDTVPTLYDTLTVAAVTQAWSGSWTLALRHGGVTAGGTLQWRWSVFKLAGQ